MGSEERPCRDDGRGTGGTLLLKSDIVNRKVPFSEDYQMEVTRPSWRAPVHKGDRIRLTGYYANKKHAWYTAMTHNGFYIDEKQKPKGRCKPYLVGKDAKKKVRQKVKARSGRVRVRQAPARSDRGRPEPQVGPRARHVLREEVRLRPVRAAVQGAARPAPRPAGLSSRTSSTYPGGRGAPGDQGLPPTVKKGSTLTFFNADQQANIRHSVTTCPYPCNGTYVSNYPWADGRWDSGTLGLDAIDGGTPNPVAETPKDLPVGKYSYFCRIHPFMRGEFRVVP